MRITMIMLLLAGAVLNVCAAEPDFLEEYIFGDASASLKMLTPGSDDYYFFSALHAEKEGDSRAFNHLLQEYRRHFPHNQGLKILENRELLKRYRKDPKNVIREIIRKHNLRFDHTRAGTRGAHDADLPTQLDPRLIATDTLINKYSGYRDYYSYYTEAGMKRLYLQSNQARRMDMVLNGRVNDPSLPDLPRIISAILKTPRKNYSFKNIPMRDELTTGQLDALMGIHSSILEDETFVLEYMSRLHAYGKLTEEDKDAALAQLRAFAKRLSAKYNSLKARLCYEQLERNRGKGVYDKQLFMEFLQYPRNSQLTARSLIKNVKYEFQADINSRIARSSGFSNPVNEKRLVTSYLEYFFQTEDSYEPYLTWLDKTYLMQTFAAARILAGNSDPQYFNMLPSHMREEIMQRVEINILPTTPNRFKVNDPVYIDLALKNTSKVYIKVYRINAESYMRKTGKEPNTDFDVYGISPNNQRTIDYPQEATTRHDEKIELPDIKTPGYYLIDIIGNGTYARALVQIGGFNLFSRSTPAGQRLTVLDEAGQIVSDAAVYIAGHAYTTGADGSFVIAYSSRQQSQTAVIVKDGIASLNTFTHEKAVYQLEAGMFLDRETVLAGNQAEVLISPRLLCNGRPVSISLLKNASVTVNVTTRDGIDTSNTEDNISLVNTADYQASFRVPDYIRDVRATIKGEVRLPWEDEPLKLQVSRYFPVSRHTEEIRIANAFLTNEEGQYIAMVLGKNGEPIPRIDVTARITNRYIRNQEHFRLQTDMQGRIHLGPLPDCSRIFLEGRTGFTRQFLLDNPRAYIPSELFYTAGEEIIIPLQVQSDFNQAINAQAFRLYRMNDSMRMQNISSELKYTNGVLSAGMLTAGTYTMVHTEEPISTKLYIKPYVNRSGYKVDADREAVSAWPVSQLRIADIAETDQGLVINLANAGKAARVHVSASFFQPDRSIMNAMRRVLRSPVETYTLQTSENLYLSTRELDPEYMYVLFRQDDPLYVGNLLERPGLILNRIETQEVDTTADIVGAAEGMGAYGARSGGGIRRAVGRGGGSAATAAAEADMNFLAQPALVKLNLRPDENGRILISKEELAGLRNVQVCAYDGINAVAGSYKLGGKAVLDSLDLRLSQALPAEQDLGQKSACRPFKAGEELVLANRASSDYVVYRTVGELYRYMQALHSNSLLEEFEFITNWGNLEEAEKKKLYSEYACHELNLFIQAKDPEFFESVVKPYIKHKMHKTFIDYYLLNEDLEQFMQPENYNQLNLFEKILIGKKRAGYTPLFVDDLFRPDPAAEERAIETALGVFGLEEDKKGSLSMKRDNARDRAKKEKSRRMAYAAEPEMAMDMPAPASAAPMEMAEEMDMEITADGFADDEMAKPQQFFRNVPKTKEYMENNYYGKRPEEMHAGMIPANGFWSDYASHTDGPFLSSRTGTIHGGFTDLMLVLALTDLPFDIPEHDLAMQGAGVKITFKDNALVFLKEITSLNKAEEQGLPVMAKSRYFYYRDINKRDENRKSVSGEFLPNTIYFNDITVINPTDRYRECDLFAQIPAGAMVFNVKGDIVRRKIRLSQYAVINERIFFYFPQTGQFKQAPARVYTLDGLIASADAGMFDVKDALTQVDKESWEFIADSGDQDAILAYLNRVNRQDVDLSRIYYLLKKETFYKKMINYVINRVIPSETVIASYGFMHQDQAGMKLWLQQSEYKRQVGWYFDSPLLAVNAIDEAWYNHLEYDPLVVPRAHSMDGRAGMDVPALQAQYAKFLDRTAHKTEPAVDDNLQYVYYMLLQNRIGEALERFADIKRKQVTPVMQYDYLACYMAFYLEEMDTAREIAEGYSQYPVPKWQKLFAEVITQLDEAEGKNRAADDSSREGRLTGLAAVEPTLELVEEKGIVRARGDNAEELEIRLYLIDIETLFSSNPFDTGLSDRFSYVMPGESISMDVSGGSFDRPIGIPEAYANRDLYIEVSTKGIVKSHLLFANSLNVQITENYGRLKVMETETNKALKKVYVKVYGMKNGNAVFYKDGYTDLRGIFDYASLSSSLIDQVSEYAILILSETHGSKIVQVVPPKQ